MDSSQNATITPASIGHMTPTQVMSMLLQFGVDEDSILDWHRCLVDTPHDILLAWIQSAKSSDTGTAATLTSPSTHANNSQCTIANTAPDIKSKTSAFFESSAPTPSALGAPQQLHCPTPGCKGKWKGSYPWFVKHFREKHLNDYWFGLEKVAWRCLCGVDFANDNHLMTHIWREHMI